MEHLEFVAGLIIIDEETVDQLTVKLARRAKNTTGEFLILLPLEHIKGQTCLSINRVRIRTEWLIICIDEVVTQIVIFSFPLG